MESSKLVTLLAPSMLAPLSVGIVGWWIKSQLKKVEQISTVLVEITHIREKITEIKAENKLEFERLNKSREEFILLQSEVKTQWKRIDDMRDRLNQREV